jgi:hypothetical protein
MARPARHAASSKPGNIHVDGCGAPESLKDH